MISIVMIVYNVGEYVEQSIKSVLNQTYRDWELILVVGKGPDQSEEICRRYAQSDDRIVLVTCLPNGAADARNRGMEKVRGDFLGFVDSDDYIEPDMFESMMKNLENTGADIAICGRFYEFVNRTEKDDKKDPVILTGEQAVGVTLSHEGFFLHLWDKLYTRKVFEGLSFRTDVVVEDRIVVDKLLAKADKVVYDSTPMYHFRERSGSCSKQEGMVNSNVVANELMQEFVVGRFPALEKECSRFMLYEYITAIQNLLVSSQLSHSDFEEYSGKVGKLYEELKDEIPKSLKIKSILAMKFPLILKLYTKKMQSKTAEEFVRFL